MEEGVRFMTKQERGESTHGKVFSDSRGWHEYAREG
jgi:hypothetical protein